MNDKTGELTYADILRVGPGTITGKFLRRFWHPVMPAADLRAGHVKPIRLLGEDFTLYRGESGEPYLVADRCPHRGVKLGLGLVRGEDLQCIYHGWQFAANGQCVKQPAEPRPFAERIRIRSYRAREYLGLIFAWIGEGEPPPIPRFPDYEDDAMYVREISTEIWPCSYFDLLENATDIAHTEFLHWQFRNKAPLEYQWTETGFGMSGEFEGATGKDSIYNHAYYHMPCAAEFASSGRSGAEGYFTVAWRVPRDDDSVIRFNVMAFPRYQAQAAPGGDIYAALRGIKKEGDVSRDASDAERVSRPVSVAAMDLLTGREDMRDLKDRSPAMNFRYLTNLQDCAVLMSLGTPESRQFTESLGRTDVSIALMRRIWLRELRLLAAGEPLKAWSRPDYLWSEVTERQREAARQVDKAG
jgi:5,5'-dehydrodivanillate O-demethylase oxygenase subunit